MADDTPIQTPQQPPKKGIGFGRGVLAYLGGSVAANLPARYLNPKLTAPVMAHQLPLTPEQVSHMQNSMGTSGVHLVGADPMHVPPRFIPPEGFTPLADIYEKFLGTEMSDIPRAVVGGVSKHPDSLGEVQQGHILAHELGHAANYLGGGIPKALQRVRGPAGLLGIGGSMAAAGLADKDSNWSKYAPIAAAAGVAPMLIEEGLATHKGLKALRGAGVQGAAYQGARNNLAKAWGSYGLTAAGAIAAPFAIRKAKQWLTPKDEPSALPDATKQAFLDEVSRVTA